MNEPDHRLEAEFASLELPELSADFWSRMDERVAAENERWYDRVYEAFPPSRPTYWLACGVRRCQSA